MTDKRPVNMDLGAFSFPITAIASILHRASGVFIFAGVAVLLSLLESSLSSAEGFADVVACLSGPLAKLVVWAIMAGLIYHICAGVRHLIMDMGIGETLEGGVLGARLVFAVSVVLILVAGLWIW